MQVSDQPIINISVACLRKIIYTIPVFVSESLNKKNISRFDSVDNLFHKYLFFCVDVNFITALVLFLKLGVHI